MSKPQIHSRVSNSTLPGKQPPSTSIPTQANAPENNSLNDNLDLMNL